MEEKKKITPEEVIKNLARTLAAVEEQRSALLNRIMGAGEASGLEPEELNKLIGRDLFTRPPKPKETPAETLEKSINEKI